MAKNSINVADSHILSIVATRALTDALINQAGLEANRLFRRRPVPQPTRPRAESSAMSALKSELFDEDSEQEDLDADPSLLRVNEEYAKRFDVSSLP